MAIGNALLFAFNRHYLTLITCGVFLASLANTAMPQLFAWRGNMRITLRVKS